jgi:flavin prenyltransferase
LARERTSGKRGGGARGMSDATPGTQRRLVVGISGASGAVYGIRLLRLLQGTGIETHLVMSRAARLTLAHETDLKPAEVEALATVVHSNADLGAACASGSFRTLGMVIAPCSVKTMGEIATGVTANLLSRAADVALKERRRLVLVLRETPLHLGHIRAMAAVTEAGAIVYPPVPAFYARPASLEEMVDHTIGRVLDLFGLDLGTVRRWTGERTRPPPRGAPE